MFLSFFVYDFLGVVGVFVFVGFIGGLFKFVGFIGGYLMVFLIAVFVISYINIKKLIKNEAVNVLVVFILGFVIIYIFGFLYLLWAVYMIFKKVFAVGVVLFIIFDVIKFVIVYLIVCVIKSCKVLNIV